MTIIKTIPKRKQMTPKEKAKDLVDSMYFYIGSIEPRIEKAKYCALIAVDEIIEALWGVEYSFANAQIEYFKEVKQEIEKL